MRELFARVKTMANAVGFARTRRCSDVALLPGQPKTYEEAITALNSFQTNAAYIKDAQKNKHSIASASGKLSLILEYLAAVGINQKELSKLCAVHISGTKGKGSTSAFCESVLRENGYRTGFFSSPHLVSVRERIRINGQPLTRNDFTHYFWQVYSQIKEKKNPDIEMPAYFSFLTVMAFSVFLSEKVDVAILEVGIGGEFDCTNVILNPWVIGITSLGLDHTELLGDTLAEIAWQKAGIMKPSSMGYTVPDQTEEAVRVLAERSIERKCPLEVVPPLESYSWPDKVSEHHILSLCPVQKLNASLALQISCSWMLRKENKAASKNSEVNSQLAHAKPFPVSLKMVHGLKACRWPGRMQILPSECSRIIYCLDGAHTRESVSACMQWYNELCGKDRSNVRHALLFHVTGKRDVTQIIEPLLSANFDRVIFSPTIAYKDETLGDNYNARNSWNYQMSKCKEIKEQWNLSVKAHTPSLSEVGNCRVVGCVSEALDEFQGEGDEWRILVTGSLHLVGAALSILDRDLKRSYQ